MVRNISTSVDPIGDVSLEIIGAHIWNDSNDGAPVLIVEQPDVLADGALVGPIATRCLLGDDRHWSAGHVGIAEPSTRHTEDPHPPKLFPSHTINPKKS